FAAMVVTGTCGRSSAGGALAASGSVEATEAALGFQLPGRIETVRRHEGDRVQAGDTLATLDRTDLLARLAQAQGQLSAAQATLAELVHGARPEELAQAREADSVAAARLADAYRDVEPLEPVVRSSVMSQAAFDKA